MNSTATNRTKPIVIVNFKTYNEATGANAITLAKACERAAKQHKIDIRLAVQAVDIAPVARTVKLPIYAQHVDNITPGQSTGWLTINAIKAAGASGAILNHAEHKLDNYVISSTTATLRKAGLDAIVCAENTARLDELQSANATIFCIEPPELIGGDVSVTNAQPDIIRHAIAHTKKPLLIGAGIKTHEDLDLALSLGAKGVLLSSGIVLAKNKDAAIAQLLTTQKSGPKNGKKNKK